MASKVQGGLGRSPLHLLHRAQQLSEVLFEAEKQLGSPPDGIKYRKLRKLTRYVGTCFGIQTEAHRLERTAVLQDPRRAS